MLRSALKLRGYHIEATDGDVGKVRDVYFDDALWRVRYLVVDVGSWLAERDVLLSPVALGMPDWERNWIPVNLSKDAIEKSPPAATDMPVSRQLESDLAEYFAWPTYWALTPMSTPAIAGANVAAVTDRTGMPAASGGEMTSEQDPHLRSMQVVSGYHIKASDGEIGHVEDFLIDDIDWVIRYVVVDTRNWLPGGKVILAPDWLDSFDWDASRATTSLSKDALKKAPEYNPRDPINRDFEGRLYDYYGRPNYWAEAVAGGHGDLRM